MILAVITCVSALQLAMNSDANWRMERHLPGSGRVLKASGTVRCRTGEGVVWTTTAPFASQVSMTTNSMIFADEDGIRVKPMDEVPYYGEIRRRTDAFVGGDTNAFDGVFAAESKTLPAGGWQLRLKPEVSGMERWFDEVTIAGDRLPTNVVMRTADGGWCDIAFEDPSRVR